VGQIFIKKEKIMIKLKDILIEIKIPNIKIIRVRI